MDLKVPDCPHALVRQEVRLDPVFRQGSRVPVLQAVLPVHQLLLSRARCGRLGRFEAPEIFAVQEG
ncbi:hypothetical protein [Paenibacillus ihbetae]|uniref:hypothetical protein n=1 Tax=Paenibacillus ihbetae TaxID=1870820 RepID=UPI0013900C32|nr:hypothetical protein [Paenibacillus ihbetae]